MQAAVVPSASAGAPSEHLSSRLLVSERRHCTLAEATSLLHFCRYASFPFCRRGGSFVTKAGRRADRARGADVWQLLQPIHLPLLAPAPLKHHTLTERP